MARPLREFIVGFEADRLCSTCKRILPATEFHLGSGGYRGHECRTCKAKRLHLRDAQVRAQMLDGEFLFPETKTCKGCGQELPKSAFGLHCRSSDGLQPQCKDCNRKRKTRQRANDHYVLRLYGLTVEQYDAMVEAQGGVCAICGRPETGRSSRGVPRRLTVDHDHETGQIRALLCSACNSAIGHFEEDPERLALALQYLLVHKASRR